VSVLVTGGAGYIGSHTVRELVEGGRDVVVLDNLEHGFAAAVGDVPLVVGDVRDRALVDKTVAEHGVDAVVHFAAYKAPGESMADPGRYFENNTCGSLALLEALVAAGVERFVFSSTCAVYGTPSVLPVAEDHPLGPESPYGESKAMVEQMLRWFDACHGLRSVSLRYFNASGAADDGAIGEDWSATTNLIPLAMKAALGHRPPLEVFGLDYPTPDGSAIRDYVHVVDLSRAHVLALEHLEAGGSSEVVNLGTGVGSSVLEVVAAAERAGGVQVPWTASPRRPGDPVAVYASYARAASVLGWAPTRGLDEIVASAWRWHSTHPHGHAGA
jgi:UDP-glucose 4-epimerase